MLKSPKRIASEGRAPTPPASDRPRVATVECVGQAILVEPPGCARVLDGLRARRYVPGPDRDGNLRIGAESGPLFATPTDSRPWRAPAGLEAAVIALLVRAGYSVRRTGRPGSRFRPPRVEAVRARGPIDPSLLALVRRHDRGLIRYAPGVDAAW